MMISNVLWCLLCIRLANRLLGCAVPEDGPIQTAVYLHTYMHLGLVCLCVPSRQARGPGFRSYCPRGKLAVGLPGFFCFFSILPPLICRWLHDRLWVMLILFTLHGLITHPSLAKRLGVPMRSLRGGGLPETHPRSGKGR
ncbi:hypothetical protein GGS20DRAFT_526274 [Poronia punctata]|nr:hypothetical protein GGS20DRAFT_526274 [Poronia punctata]